MSMLKPKSDIETVRQFILTDLEEGIKKLPVEWDSTNKGRATSGAALALKGKVLLYAGKYDEAKKCFRELIGETENSQYAGVYKLYEEGENPYSDLFKPGGDESSEMILPYRILVELDRTSVCQPLSTWEQELHLVAAGTM